MRISLWTPDSHLPGCDAWGCLKDFLPEHDWVDARDDDTDEVDLQVVLVPHADQRASVSVVPTGPALFVVPDASTFRAWAGLSHRAVGFACFSGFTAELIRQTQVAPCTVLPRNPLTGFTSDLDDDGDGTVAIVLPGGDLASALIVGRWLGEFADSRAVTEIRILGPFTADALHELRESTRKATARVVLHSRPSDDEVAGVMARSSRAAFVDRHPEAEVSPYMWQAARRGVPTFIHGAGAYADLPVGIVTRSASDEAFGRDLDSFIHGDQTAFAHQVAQARSLAEASHGRHDFARALAQAIDVATAFRPFEEAVHSVRLNLAHRGLSDSATQRAAAASLDWMLGQQPTRGTSVGGPGR